MLWDDGNHVYTYVSDAPPADITAMLRTLVSGSDPDGAGELANRLIAPFLWVTFDLGPSAVRLAC